MASRSHPPQLIWRLALAFTTIIGLGAVFMISGKIGRMIFAPMETGCTAIHHGTATEAADGHDAMQENEKTPAHANQPDCKEVPV
jgi:hypothetical protein